MDRCRQERLAALRRLIEDAEASGISDYGVEEVFAEGRVLSDDRASQRGVTVDDRDSRAFSSTKSAK